VPIKLGQVLAILRKIDLIMHIGVLFLRKRWRYYEVVSARDVTRKIILFCKFTIKKSGTVVELIVLKTLNSYAQTAMPVTTWE
jgi:hypothetical protein